MFRWIALLAAIVLIVAIAGAVVVSQPTSHPTEEQASEKDKKENATQENNKTLWNRWFPDSISLFTLFLVVFTAVLAVGGLYQLKFLERAERIAATSAQAAKESADTAKNALVAANRAWVKADIQPGPVFYNVNGVNFTIRFILKNIGHSPATDIFPNPQVFAPALGVNPPDGTPPSGFNFRAELEKIIAFQKSQVGNRFGFALFPNESVVQDITVSIGKEELARITQKVEFIVPRIIGTVSYRMGLDTDVHQTGFVFMVGRKSPRTDRADTAIFPDEGDIPAENVRYSLSILDGGYAD